MFQTITFIVITIILTFTYLDLSLQKFFLVASVTFFFLTMFNYSGTIFNCFIAFKDDSFMSILDLKVEFLLGNFITELEPPT